MTPERWAEIKRVLAGALQLPREHQASFVSSSCGSDSELQGEVQSLLEAGERFSTIPFVEPPRSTASTAANESDAVRGILGFALGGQYEILREIGRGGMGAIYLAREKALERLVAIKVLRPELADSSESRERFRREARIAANLSHPGILQLHTFGEVTGVWFFVMSYVDGESLADLLHRRPRLAWTEAHRILLELTDALACAHRNKVVHRDIKPANVLLEKDTGHAILADFGISKIFGATDPLTRSGIIIGTPDYMSPEQLMGSSDVDERSDIYSLGALGYASVCGRLPFVAESATGAMYSRLLRDPTPVRDLNPTVPESFADALTRCLAREPADRWQSAEHFRKALEDISDKALETLPEGIRDIPSFGPFALIWAAAWASFAFAIDTRYLERALLLTIAGLVPCGLFLHVWLMGGRGIGVTRLMRVALRPPEWWSMYWPKGLRRPSDLWGRLPLPARAFRILASVFLLLIPGTIILREWIGVSWNRDVVVALVTTEVLAVILWVLAALLAWRWTNSRGLSPTESIRLMLGPTTSSTGWHSPRLERVLSSAGSRVRAPDPDQPADYARAIKELAGILPADLANLRLTAVDAAEYAAALLERDAAKVSSMKEEIDPSDMQRIQGRLTALGDASPGETGESTEMRNLLQHELELVQSMSSRLELANSFHLHRFSLLRSLYEIMSASFTISEGRDPQAIAAHIMMVCSDLRGATAATTH